MASEQITWAGRTLSGLDRYGEWACEVPDGWWDSPESKGNVVDRELADGEYDTEIYNAARLVTWSGKLYASSHEAMHEAQNFLTGAMTGRLQVAGHGPTQWADAKRIGRIRFEPLTDTIATWQVPLKCPKPQKYGERRTFDMTPSTPVQVIHRGNYKASPVVQINGPLTGGVTITHPSGQFVVLGDLGVGGWVRVDMATGRLKLNGNDRSDLIGASARLHQITPGLPASQFSINRGVGYVEVLDTFI